MSAKGIIEQQQYKLSAFARELGIDAPRAKCILKRLMRAGIAKSCKQEQTDGWQDEALHGEYLDEGITFDTCFKFVYVGIVEIDGLVIKFYPKFIKGKPSPEDMRRVIYSVERYNSEHTSLDITNASGEERAPNHLVLALAMLRDYFTYGLYSNQREELVLQGTGDIDWETTIDTTMPMIRNNKPYYFDYYTYDTKQDDTDYISRLHACIVTECSEKLHQSELADILQLNTPPPYIGERIDFGPDDYIAQRIRKEINVQYVSHKQATLRNMLAWIELTRVTTSNSSIQMFGTNSFHTLWEAMCADVFESQYTQPLTSLGIELKNGFRDSKETLADLIERPQWQAIGSNHRHMAMETLRPDYVRVIRGNHENHGHFVILDAKYYDIELDDRHVSGQPGVEDVSKQYLYQLAYHKFIYTHSLTPVNAFLSPSDSNTSHLMGKAIMPIFSYLPNADLQSINVVKLSAKKVMEHYIARTKMSLQKEMAGLFVSKGEE